MGANTSSSSGVGVLGLLGITFVVLKLTGFIDWSWWWVTLPFWGGFALAVALFIGFVIAYGRPTRKPTRRRPY
jgi:hypothetical protein